MVFWPLRHVGSQLLEQGLEPVPSALEGGVLAGGPPGKSRAESSAFGVPLVVAES